jgi:hypothetical protein
MAIQFSFVVPLGEDWARIVFFPAGFFLDNVGASSSALRFFESIVGRGKLSSFSLWLFCEEDV